MSPTNPFRPIVQQTPGEPDPTSQDAADLAAERAQGAAKLVEPTDRQMFRVETRDPEIYNELHHRLSILSLAHMAIFGECGVTGGHVVRTAQAIAQALSAGGERGRESARHTVTALIQPSEANEPGTWERPLGRMLVMLGAYPHSGMPRVTAGTILGVTRQRIGQMVSNQLLQSDQSGFIVTDSLVRLMVPADRA